MEKILLYDKKKKKIINNLLRNDHSQNLCAAIEHITKRIDHTLEQEHVLEGHSFLQLFVKRIVCG